MNNTLGNKNSDQVTTNQPIVVTTQRLPSSYESGIVVVSVAKEFANTGDGFSFKLPVDIVKILSENRAKISVTTTNGEALPSWLIFNPDAANFIASPTPAGAFPFEVIISFGNQNIIVFFSEMTLQ